MFSNRLPNPFKTISARVALWYTSIFIMSSVLLFVFVYYLISATLEKAGRDKIRIELGAIFALHKIGGIDGVANFIAEKNRAYKTYPFLIRIADSANKTRYLFWPEQWSSFDPAKLEKIRPATESPWIRLAGPKTGYVLDISSAPLSKDYWVQVGTGTEGRERVLLHFREGFMIVVIPLFVIGLGGGLFLSRKTLQPIRNLIRTVRSIDIGNTGTKVPRSRTDDELDELAKLFNEMLDNIYRLIDGMRHSLDNVAHDLRTPMTRLRNISEIALQTGSNADLFKEALEKCVEESEHILVMLETLMDISEAEIGVMNIDRQIVDISALVEKVVDLYQLVAEEKGIDFSTRTPEHLWVAVDATRIGQALANVIDNAIKFTPAGGRVTLEASQDTEKVVIEIRDTGIGIAPEELDRIWERLYRGEQSRSEKGIGLGLSLVKGIVDAHAGRVDVLSEPGKGSTFILTLPTPG
jgi:signal transduction histidine kinase